MYFNFPNPIRHQAACACSDFPIGQDFTEKSVPIGAQARNEIRGKFEDKERIFVELALAQYVSQDVYELGTDKLVPLLRLRYHDPIADAGKDLVTSEEIRSVFSDFLKYLYYAHGAA